MRKKLMLASIFVLAATGPALAGGKEGTVGIGAEFGLVSDVGRGPGAGVGGASMNYDASVFHVGGFLGFRDGGGNNDTDYTFGARFYYHLHETTMSDFGVGGMLGFYSLDDTNAPERQTLLYLEPGIQIRAFVANNVALSFSTGISFGLVDANGASVGGQFVAQGGVHYYFFN
jgi:hypothetical protein